ncbi:arginase [Paenibacillus lycopersici]|uniref:Arginase n=1 Tax=Paenibacillus lycopersici TaxID=2704462 RepID=A0A6C0G476_9BACL|nr:arginase [Paenibacillus lycopersici]QHT61560.1 arginase [Paenibacillus lycopersici]
MTNRKDTRGSGGRYSAGSGRKLHLIQVPFGLGAGRPGNEAGPESMIQAGLLRQLRKTAYEVTGESRLNAAGRQANPAVAEGPVKHAAEVGAMCRSVSEAVAEASERGELPLVLGGDHSVTIGVLAGLAAKERRVGVIYFDAHAGLHTEAGSPSGHIGGMSLAVALGYARPALGDVGGLAGGSAIRKQNVVLIGVRDVEPEERELILSEGITVFTMHEIDRMGIEAVIGKALEIAGDGTDGIHVSFSADCLDPLEAPGVGMQVPGGLTYREAHFACELLAESGRIASIDMVEVNAMLDESRRTARLAIGLIASLLGKRIL